MEKKWAVEVWGEVGPYTTELFFTERQAMSYFKKVRKGLDSTKYLFSKDSIIDKYNSDNAVYITNLNEL